MKIKIIQKVDEWEYNIRNRILGYSIIGEPTIIVKEGIRELGYGDRIIFRYIIIKERSKKYSSNVIHESDNSTYIYNIGETIKVRDDCYTIKNKINNVNGEVEYIVESATVEPENKDQILEKLYKEQESLIEKYKQAKEEEIKSAITEEEIKSAITEETEPTNKKSLYDYIGGMSILGISVSVIAFFVWVLVSL